MAVGREEFPFLGKGFEWRTKKTDEPIWNVFVQILLPLVLILTFVAVLDILRYKHVAEVERIESHKLRKFITEKLEKIDPQKEHNKYKVTLIELQYLKLSIALRDVEKEKREDLKLTQFPDAGKIDLTYTKIIDIDFKELCKKAKDIFDNNGEQGFKDGIYKEVLRKASVKDTGKWNLRVRQWNPVPKDEPYTATLSSITPGNRAKIHNDIVEFVETLRKNIRLLQTQLLHRLFDELIKNPEELDNHSRKLVEKIISTKEEDERKRLAKDFYQKMVRKWRDQLETEGYEFLEDTWDKLI